MSARRRWAPIVGTSNRIYETRERWAVGAFDAAVRAGAWTLRAMGLARAPHVGPRVPVAHVPALDLSAFQDVLVLRLDRLGDVVMSLPALADLRAALPAARIRLAVGRWSEDVARSAPVDEVLTWSAPWVGRAAEGAETTRALFAEARALRAAPPDLAIDLQGDVRATLLLACSGARRRVGYANSGGAALLTHVVPLDEQVSWVEQNRRAVALALGRAVGQARLDPLRADERAFAERLLANLRLEGQRPLVGLHPSGGRAIKQWDVERWGEVAARLENACGATFLITGSAQDAPLAKRVCGRLKQPSYDLTGRLRVRETLALLERLDLFLSPDTGPMHMACAVGTPSLSIFGPSDPARYFSGGSGAPGTRHVVLRAALWCAPCNLIRSPPDECASAPMPECLRLVSVEQVCASALRLLGRD